MKRYRLHITAILTWICFILLLSSPAVAAPVLDTISAIKRLNSQESAHKYPVLIHGQVLHFHPEMDRVFIYDGRAGMYVQLLDVVASDLPDLRLGSEVMVSGETRTGGFSPVVFCSEITVTGWNPLPPAKKSTRAMHETSSMDVEWVELSGTPISVEYEVDYGHLVVSMEVFDTVMDLYIPYTPETLDEMAAFIFREVRVSGVLGTRANAYQQMTGRILYVNSVDDFILQSKEDDRPSVLIPTHELLKYGKNYQGLVKTRGTVVDATSGELYLRGDKNSLKVAIFGQQNFRPGDVLEVTGYAHMEPVSPSFRAVSIEKIEQVSPPPPLEIGSDDGIIDLGWNNEWVRIDANFIYLERTFRRDSFHVGAGERDLAPRETLWCQVGNRLFEAKLPAGVPVPSGLRPGSRIRLVGICHLTENKDPRLAHMVESLWLELAGPERIVVIKQPPWWDPKRLLWGLSITLLACLLFVSWVVLLRKTVASQTSTIGKQIERETVLSERQRIARELHDTLEQGLTALSFQLGRIVNKVKVSAPDDLPIVERAIHTLRACREESRASIQDLRGGVLEVMDLPSALRHLIEPRLNGTDIQLEIEADMQRLPLFVEHRLVRIITEAVFNAINHAQPSKITIGLFSNADQIHVEVIDDGCGFDLSILDDCGRFGVLGMHERAKRLRGTLEVVSELGCGSRVLLTVPMENLTEG